MTGLTHCGRRRQLWLKPAQADRYNSVDKKCAKHAEEQQGTAEKPRLTFPSSDEAAPERHTERSASLQANRHDYEADAGYGEKYPTCLIDLHLAPRSDPIR